MPSSTVLAARLLSHGLVAYKLLEIINSSALRFSILNRANKVTAAYM